MVCVFKQLFSIFKQYYTYFYIFFYLHVFTQIFSNNNFQFLNTSIKCPHSLCNTPVLCLLFRFSFFFSWLDKEETYYPKDFNRSSPSLSPQPTYQHRGRDGRDGNIGPTALQERASGQHCDRFILGDIWYKGIHVILGI